MTSVNLRRAMCVCVCGCVYVCGIIDVSSVTTVSWIVEKETE